MEARQQNGPTLCVNGCGFHGSAETESMCSKCYRDHKKETQAAQQLVKQLSEQAEAASANQESVQLPVPASPVQPAQIEANVEPAVLQEEEKVEEDSAMASPRNQVEAEPVIEEKAAAQ